MYQELKPQHAWFLKCGLHMLSSIDYSTRVN